jgi:zinc/manganese transport system permease protein
MLEIMKWPLVACLLLPGLLVYLGAHIVRREVIFVDLALAQIAALGSCVALLAGFDLHDKEAFGIALGFTFVGAAIFSLTRTRDHRVPQEAIIGIVYVVSAAAAILVLSRSPEGDEEIRKTLIGEILLVTPKEVFATFGLYAALAAVHAVFRKQFLAISFSPEAVAAKGISVRWWDFWFYVTFGFVVTSFVRIGGVLLVFSYLIVPAVCGQLLSQRLGVILAIGWIVAAVGGIGGLVASYQFDLPTGAAIVCALGLLLLVAAVTRVATNGAQRRP